MKLSVIILNYNVKHFLQLCLQSVTKALKDIDSEIIVIDNASEDGSMTMVSTCFPHVKQIQNVKNLGFSKANNKAVRHAKGEYVCILNPDTVVAEDTFRKITDYAQTVPDFGAIGVRLIDGQGRFLPESKRQLPTPKVAIQKLVGKKGGYYATSVSAIGIGKVDVLVGAFMFMRRDRYNQVGGFDEDYFMYGEDIDLSYKLQKAGYINYYNGTLPVIHFKGESTSKDKTYRNRFYEAMNLFYKKHFSKSNAMHNTVSLGLKFAKTLKSLQSHHLPKPLQPAVILYIGKNEQMPRLLYKLLNTETSKIDLKELKKLQLKSSQLVFDATHVSFVEIIELMIMYSGFKNTFRIELKNPNILIGSDSSTSKGSVHLLESSSI